MLAKKKQTKVFSDFVRRLCDSSKEFGNICKYCPLELRVCNGTGQCNFLGQRDKSSFNNGTSSKSCYCLGRVGIAYQNPGRTWDGTTLFFCQNPGRNRDGTGQSLFFPITSCFRTSFSVLERLFLFKDVLFLF